VVASDAPSDSLSQLRAHISSIQDVSNDGAAPLSKLVLLCINLYPEKLLTLLTTVVTLDDANSVNLQPQGVAAAVKMIRLHATEVLTTFVSSYKDGTTMPPSQSIDIQFARICKHWPSMVQTLVKNGVYGGTSLNLRPPEDIQFNVQTLMQILLDGRCKEGVQHNSPVRGGESTDPAFILDSLVTMLCETKHGENTIVISSSSTDIREESIPSGFVDIISARTRLDYAQPAERR
jgi:hypothetical protein